MMKFSGGQAAVGLILALGAAAGFVAGCGKSTPVAPTDALLTITVNPTRIDSTGEAKITVLARKPDGFPVNPGTEINFSTSLGRIEPAIVKTDEQGRAETTLFGNGEIGEAVVTAISGTIEIQTEAIQIGSLPFSITLDANPGEIDINNIPRNKGKKIKVTATVLDDLGQPMEGVFVQLDSEIGNFDSAKATGQTNANGVFKDNLRVEENQLGGVDGDFFLITAQTVADDEAGEGNFLSTELEIDLIGFPFDIVLEAARSSIDANGDEFAVTATVTDELGDPLAEVGVQFSTSGVGSMVSRGAVINTDANGQAHDRFRADEQDIAAISGNTFTITAQTLGRDSAGPVELTASETITIQGLPPIAQFSSSGSCRIVTFVNTTTPASTTAAPVEFLWDFGDSSPTSTETNPVHTYARTGGFDVTLTATSQFGEDSVTERIIVNEATVSAAFTESATGLTVSFDASNSTGDPPLTYTWDFGDTSSGSGVAPTHTYAAAGLYTVKLTVTACAGEAGEVSSTVSKTITVS